MKGYITKALILTGFTLLISVNSVSASTELTDIKGSYAKEAILELVEKGIITGENGKFNPRGKIERQDFAIILANALQLDTSKTPAQATFSDIPAKHYAFPYVEAAVKAGLMDGSGEGKFGLNQYMTREEMAILFVKSLGVDATGYGDKLTFADTANISVWAKDAVGYAVEAGMMVGDTTSNRFNPQGLANRQQVALVSSKFIKQAESLGITPPIVTEPPTQVPPVVTEPPREQPPVVEFPGEEEPIEEQPGNEETGNEQPGDLDPGEETNEPSTESEIEKVEGQTEISSIEMMDDEYGVITVYSSTTVSTLLVSIVSVDESIQTYKFYDSLGEEKLGSINNDPILADGFTLEVTAEDGIHKTTYIFEVVPRIAE